MLGELIGGGFITDGGPDYSNDIRRAGERLARIEKKLGIRGPKKPQETPISKVAFHLLATRINGATTREMSIIKQRFMTGK
jgi:hypothetical protein